MSHHLDHPIGTEKSYLVFQRRRERGELGLGDADCTCQPLYAVPSILANRRKFIPDVEEGTDAPNPNPRVRASVECGE